MTEITGTGDPARSLSLLWRLAEPAPRGRGAEVGLSVDRVVGAAIALADAEGLAALSMRRLAADLGVGAMTLYTYVPGKAELLDLMVDSALGEFPSLYAPAADEWRARLEAVARASWSLYERHPWLLQVAASGRPPLGPGVLTQYELSLQAVDGTGLDEVAMDAVVTLVTGFVAGTARGVVEQVAAERATGISETEWWEATAPVFDQVFDPERFPTVTRVGPVAGEAQQASYDPRRAFEFGLARLLDGVAVLVEGVNPA
ncbi:TetR/AcrR family transcriptional regulator [Cellulomonas fengjieae]|uniref:TetR/AcrR family transcriptional regulator n=1 Tax=Cellulomonas fengjieae TaxID=2819978 RepID=A0ABS3SKG8_9CELL|nr:TetR/AcrR family transcriptional regulator C-terminal domain-containing protein [Cellulomonas fengjieae]MBO3086251.1 TetR/AcrR family transcriptional regulator [Cellulomonas fengjieae]QVI65703.1 TetR/AcrR family transcriptional regulator [Cellulomonas fengjieae]